MPIESGIQVLVRVCPTQSPEVDSARSGYLVVDEEACSLSLDRQQKGVSDFKFTSVLGPAAKQDDVFSRCRALILESLLGYSCCVMAYGQTGSGKTYTMYGKDWEQEGEEMGMEGNEGFGIIPRSVDLLFEALEQQASERDGSSFDFSIQCQVMQIYNEKIYDLLHDKKRENPLQLRESGRGAASTVHVKGLSVYPVYQKEDVLNLLRRAMSNRATRATEFNQVSSRSHTVLQLFLQVEDEDSDGVKLLRRSVLSLVDLAGSEKWRPSLSQQADVQKEMNNINTSLHALGNCVSALIEPNRKHIPFRSSVLTRLLQDSLGGNGKTMLIATVQQDQVYREESYSTLQFANRASKVKMTVSANVGALEDLSLEQAKQQILHLRNKLNELSLGSSGTFEQSAYKPLAQFQYSCASCESSSARILELEQEIRQLQEHNSRLQQLLLEVDISHDEEDDSQEFDEKINFDGNDQCEGCNNEEEEALATENEVEPYGLRLSEDLLWSPQEMQLIQQLRDSAASKFSSSEDCSRILSNQDSNELKVQGSSDEVDLDQELISATLTNADDVSCDVALGAEISLRPLEEQQLASKEAFCNESIANLVTEQKFRQQQERTECFQAEVTPHQLRLDSQEQLDSAVQTQEPFEVGKREDQVDMPSLHRSIGRPDIETEEASETSLWKVGQIEQEKRKFSIEEVEPTDFEYRAVSANCNSERLQSRIPSSHGLSRADEFRESVWKERDTSAAPINQSDVWHQSDPQGCQKHGLEQCILCSLYGDRIVTPCLSSVQSSRLIAHSTDLSVSNTTDSFRMFAPAVPTRSYSPRSSFENNLKRAPLPSLGPALMSREVVPSFAQCSQHGLSSCLLCALSSVGSEKVGHSSLASTSLGGGQLNDFNVNCFDSTHFSSPYSVPRVPPHFPAPPKALPRDYRLPDLTASHRYMNEYGDRGGERQVTYEASPKKALRAAPSSFQEGEEELEFEGSCFEVGCDDGMEDDLKLHSGFEEDECNDLQRDHGNARNDDQKKKTRRRSGGKKQSKQQSSRQSKLLAASPYHSGAVRRNGQRNKS